MLPHFICGHGACGSMHTKRHTRMYYTFLGEGGNQAKKFALFELLHQHGAYLSFRTGSMTEMGPSPFITLCLSSYPEQKRGGIPFQHHLKRRVINIPPLLLPFPFPLAPSLPPSCHKFWMQRVCLPAAKFCHRRGSSTNWKLVAERTGASTFFKKVLESFDDLVVVWENGDFDYILHMRLIFSYFVLPGFSQGIAKETGESCADFFFFFVGLAKRIARKFEI